jgi:fructosamine-3-kinase
LWLRDNHSVEITRFDAASGGCINRAGSLSLSDGERLFVKLQNNPPEGFFGAEAHGLECLRQATGLRVPRVIHADREFLLLEDLGSARPAQGFWQELGEGLAQLHRRQYPLFGFESDNYCGLTPQCNAPTADGADFFAHYRLSPLAGRASQAGLLDLQDQDRIAYLSDNLARWIPAQPAVLIHGDLWPGNVHCDGAGNPALIDPACYRGWAEAELAMTILFGGFPGEFYQAYEANGEVDSAWRERAPLYNLYHLLNHLLLFGTGYLGQVREVLQRFS